MPQYSLAVFLGARKTPSGVRGIAPDPAEYFTPLAYILHVCTIYNPIFVNFAHVTTLHLDVPLMGRQQIEAPWTFYMALAYFCDISSLLCNKVCVQMNLLCATYCLLPSMVFHSTIKLSKYVSSCIFALFLCHL